MAIKVSRLVLFTILLFTNLQVAQAQLLGVPELLPFQGRLTDNTSGVPINYTVPVKFRIYPPTGTCYLYEETQTITPNNYGLFSVLLGGAGNASGPPNVFSNVFRNSATGIADSCAGTYLPAANDWRRVEIVVNGTALSQMQTLGASVYALQAKDSATFGGKYPNQFIQTSGTVTQANVLNLTNGTDAGALHNHDSVYARIDGNNSYSGNIQTATGIYATGASGTIGIGTNSTAADIQISKAAPSIRLTSTASGGGIPKIDFFSGGSTQRASIRSSESANELRLYTGTTEALRLDSAQNAYLAGSLVVSGTIGMGRYSNAQETTLITALTAQGASAAGTMWENSTTGSMRYWNGTSAQTLATSSGSSFVNSVTAGTGISISGTSTDPIVSLTATTVSAGSYGSVTSVPSFTVDASGRLTAASNTALVLSGDVTGNIGTATVEKIRGTSVNITSLTAKDLLQYNGSAWVNTAIPTCSAGQYITYNGTVWSCASASAGSVTSVGISVPGFMTASGGPITSSGSISLGFGSQTAKTVFAAPTGAGGAPTFRSLNIADIQSSVAGGFLTGSSCSAGQALVFNTVTDTISCSSVVPTVSNAATLASGKIWVGDGSNLAQALSVTGDAGLSNAGVLTVNGWSGKALNGSFSASNKIAYYNSTSDKIEIVTLPTCSVNQYLSFNGSTWSCSADVGASGLVTSVSVSYPLTVAGTASAPVIGLAKDAAQFDLDGSNQLHLKAGGITNTEISASAAIARSKLAAGTISHVLINDASGNLSSEAQLAVSRGGTGQSSFTDGQLLIGNSTGNTLTKSTLTAGSGITITNGSGSITIAASAGTGTVTSVGISVPAYMSTSGGPITSSGSISLGFGSQTAKSVFAAPQGSSGSPSFRSLNIADIQSTVSGGFLTGTTCTAGQALIYSSVTDTISCSAIQASVSNSSALANTKIWVGDGSNVAQAVNLSGDATLSNTGLLTLANSGVTAGTYTKVTVDAKGRVTTATSISSSDIISGLTYTPVNKAGDTLTGSLGLYAVSSDPAGLGTSDKGKVWYNTTSSQVKYWDGTAALALGTAGSGLTSLNGLTGSTQTFAAPGTSGTAPAWTSATSTHTLNIPMANTVSVTAGLISKTEFDTFDSKLGAVSNTATLTNGKIWVGDGSNVAQALSLSGDATLSNAGVLTIGSSAISNSKLAPGAVTASKLDSSAANGELFIGNGSGFTKSTLTAGSGISITNGGGSITIAASGGTGTVTSVTGTSPIAVATGTSTPVISISEANTTTNGYLSSTDWNTFNSKLGTGTSFSGDVSGNYNSLSLNTVPVAKGGTGLTGAGSANQILGVNNGASGLEYKTITAGSGITVTHGANSVTIASAVSGGGSVSSVGLSLPAELSVTNSPVTGSGTLTGAWASQTAKTVFAAPAGASGTPSFRSLSIADIQSSVAGDFLTGSSCSAGQALVYNSVTDTISCSSVIPTVSNAATLASGKIWVGDGSNLAQALNISGDAELSDSGVLTLVNSGVTAGSYTKVTVDAKGRVTTATSISSSDIISGLTYTPVNKAGDTLTGNLTAPGFFYSSDRRLKTEIQDINGLEMILALHGVSFKWKSNGKPEIGLIAQEVEAVLPELVQTNPETGIKSVKYGNLVAPLIESTKELHQKYSSLENRVQKIERGLAVDSVSRQEYQSLLNTVQELKNENAELKNNLQQVLELLKNRK